MFDRPREFCRSDHRLQENKTISPGETVQARFKTWLKEKLVAPISCQRHPAERLVYCRAESGIWDVYEEFPCGYDPKPLPGIFDFRVVLCCPACRCAYALCPPEFHETSFDTFDTSTPERTTALASARDFARQVNKHGCGFALFVGPTGPGKTRLACNIIRVLDNRDAMYVRQGELTCALRATYGRKDVILHGRDDHDAGDDPPTLLEIVQKVRFLVLDEIGCTALASDDRLLLDELLKHRYEQRKPTILISNLPLKGTSDAPGVKEFLGDALTDRIREASGNGKFIVQFSGESYRRNIGENYLGGLG